MHDPAKTRLPNLLIIGAMKASTTLLYQMLGRHPEVWFPSEKEPHYFTNAADTPGAWEEYLQLFAACPSGKRLIGEASTGYTKLPWLGPTPQRIRAKLGSPKLIYILRDPVARAISNYRHAYARGFYPDGLTFGAAIERDPIVLAASRYESQIRAYEDVFGEGAVHIVIADDLHTRPARVMEEVESYLDLPPFGQWYALPPAINSADSVRISAGWNRMIGKRWTRLISYATPVWAKQSLRRAISPPAPHAPPICPADEQRCFIELRDDLEALWKRLGDRIATWPSVQKQGPAARQNGFQGVGSRGSRLTFELEATGV